MKAYRYKITTATEQFFVVVIANSGYDARQAIQDSGIEESTISFDSVTDKFIIQH